MFKVFTKVIRGDHNQSDLAARKGWSRKTTRAANELAKVLNPRAKLFCLKNKAATTLLRNRQEVERYWAKGFYGPVIVDRKSEFLDHLPAKHRNTGDFISEKEKESLCFSRASKKLPGQSEFDRLNLMGISEQKIAGAENHATQLRRVRNYLLQNVKQQYRKHFSLISENQFDLALQKSADHFFMDLGDRKFQVLSNSANKSENWVIGKLLSIPEFQTDEVLLTPLSREGLDKFKAIEVLTKIEEIEKEGCIKEFLNLRSQINRALDAYYENHPDLVIADDCSYSGKQLFSKTFSTTRDTLVHIAPKVKTTHPIRVHFIVPFVSAKAQQLSKKLQKEFRGRLDIRLHSAGHIQNAKEVKEIPRSDRVDASGEIRLNHMLITSAKVADAISLGKDAALEHSGSYARYKTEGRAYSVAQDQVLQDLLT